MTDYNFANTEIIKSLEQEIENLKMELKLKDEIIELYKRKQIIQPSPFIYPITETYIGDIIPNPVTIT